MKTQIEEEEKRHRQLPLELTAIADISCSLPSCDVIPDNLGLVFDQPRLPRLLNSKCYAKLAPQWMYVFFAPAVTPLDISAQLKCVANPSLSQRGEIIQKGVGIYSVNITPQVRGRVKDQEITGSPFQVFVRISPSQLGQNVRKIGDITYPWGIASNDRQQLVVAESAWIDNSGNRRVRIIQRHGQVVQTIKHAEFQDPCGVATGADGSIYVTDMSVPCLFKFSREGTLIKIVVGDESESSLSIKIIQNQLYVVDNCLVKIFDMDCNVIGTIQTTECPNPADIAEGPDGLYVAGKKSICVYSLNGAFIRQLNFQPSSLKLSEFNGICFDSTGHIIASDYDNGVFVFKPSGECVRQIDSHFKGPAGVAVDEDGFVYVCDVFKNEVVVL